MRKLLSIILTVIFILSSVVPTYAANEKLFYDIKGHWAEDIIKEKAKRGFVSGYSDGSFRPNDNLTIAELITMTNKFLGLSKTKDNVYEDVTKEWYSREADKTEYYQYWKETHLNGNSNATRLDILKILDNLLQVPATDEIAPFKDMEGLKTEELDLLNRFYAAGYIQGDGQGNANLLGTLTRAEMLTIFDNCLGYIVITQEDVKHIPKGGKVTLIGQNLILDGVEIEELIISPGVYTDVTIKNSKIDTLKVFAENTQENIHLLYTDIGKIQNPKGIIIEAKTIENKTTENRSTENKSSKEDNYTIIDAQVPQITTDLTDHSVLENTLLTLEATATVSDGGVISYEWYSADDASRTNPQAISNGTSASYTVNTTTGGAYFYYCKVTNTNTAVNGNTTKEIETAVSKVTVSNLVDAQVPQITIDLTDHSVLENTILALNAAATVSDGGTISYEWYSADDALKANPQLKGTDANFTVNTTTGGAYFYYCKVTNTNTAVNGNTTKAIETAVSKVTVTNLVDAQVPQITTDLTDHSVLENTILALNAAATVSDGGTISYEWYSADDALKANPQAISNGTSASYTVNTTTGGAYFYYCKVTNTNTAVNGNTTKAIETAVSKVTVTNLVDAQVPQITTDLTDQSVLENTLLTLEAAATVSDGGTISYEWYSADDASRTNPKAISNGTSASYTVNTTTGGAYFYYCKVTNTNTAVNGNTTKVIETSVSKVTVINIVNAQAPQITTDLTDHSVLENTLLALDAAATVSDGGTISYQWYSADDALKTNPQAISNGTSASYTVNTTTGGTYFYYCKITNTNTAVNGNTTKAIETAVSKVAVVHMLGEGTESSPFIIKSVEDLCLSGTGTNPDGNTYGLNSSYKLEVSLDLADPSSYEDASAHMDNLSGWDYVNENTIATTTINGNAAGFSPIGKVTDKFTGIFDGNNETISNLYIHKTTNYTGLFGYTGGAKIYDVGLVEMNLTATYYLGGLVGYNDNSTVSNCYGTGVVRGYKLVGGLIGNNNNSTVSNCYTNVDVSGDDYYIGGLMGVNYNSTISNSYALGTVSGDEYVGGLLGQNYNSTISNSYALGTVSGDEHVGGLVGNNTGGSIISNSYATGALNGRLAVGGLSGANEGSTVEDSIAFNSEITGLDGIRRKRVVGYNDSTLISNYANVTMMLYSSTVTSNDSVNENGADIDNMTDKTALPLSNWEFDTDGDGDDAYWVLMPGTNRPVLFIDADDNGTFDKLGSDDGM